MTRLLTWSAQYEGIPFTAFRVAVKLLGRLGGPSTNSDWFRRMAETRFDRRFGVNTAGVVSTGELGVPHDRREHANEYWPTSAHRFGWLLSRLEIEYSDYTFIDFGSGKGRALLMASSFPFREVIGVEFSRDLHETAEKNIGLYRGPRQAETVRSICADAAEYEFPSSPLVLYFFNPFSDSVLAEVLENLRQSLEERPRRVIAIYFNPQEVRSFHEAEYFKEKTDRFRLTSDWAVYETQLAPEANRLVEVC